MASMELTVSLSEMDRALIADLIVALKEHNDKGIDTAAKKMEAAAAKKTEFADKVTEPEFTVVEEPSPFESPEPVTKRANATEADIRNIVMRLAKTPKKDEAKKIALRYSAKVSEIPEDKRNEVYDDLVALEAR